MNLQARIKGFVALGHQLSDPNNTLLNEAKLEAFYSKKPLKHGLLHIPLFQMKRQI